MVEVAHSSVGSGSGSRVGHCGTLFSVRATAMEFVGVCATESMLRERRERAAMVTCVHVLGVMCWRAGRAGVPSVGSAPVREYFSWSDIVTRDG